MITEFQLLNPEDNLPWKVRVDLTKKMLLLSSVDEKYRWIRKIGNNLPVDAFLVEQNVFITWERPDTGYDRLQENSIIHAQDLHTGKKLWEWEDFIITVLPYQQYAFIITYREKFNKGFVIKTKARNGEVVWKVASNAPIISWDINEKRMILKDNLGRVYALNTNSGKINKRKKSR